MKTILLTALWLLVTFYAIRSLGLFKRSGLSTGRLYFFFLVKLLCGFALYLVYSHYYPYQNTSDAFKYFDDSQVVYQLLPEKPVEFLKIVTGIDSNDPALNEHYGRMETWFREKTYTDGYNDNRTIVRINAALSLVSLGVYYVHIIFFCFVSFTGLVLLYRYIRSFGEAYESWIALILFLSPSVLFWSSGVLKEAVLFFALGGFLFSLDKAISSRSPAWLVRSILFFFILLLVKNYILLALLPALLFWGYCKHSANTHRMKISGLIILVAGLVILGYLFTDPGRSLIRSVSERQKDFINISKGGAYLISCYQRDTIYLSPHNELKLHSTDSSHFTLLPGTVYHNWTYWKILDTVHVDQPDTTCYTIYGIFGKTGSSFELTELASTPVSLIKLIPEAVCNTLFRPYPSEVRSAFIAISFLENMIYLFFMVMVLLNFQKPDQKRAAFIAGSVLFTLLLAIIIGFVTPVTGAIVRYRIPYIPFILCSILLLANRNKLRLPSFIRAIVKE